MKCFDSWGGGRGFFRYFVEFELFVLFSFEPTTKTANGSRSTFLGVFVVFECLRFFLRISYYTELTSFCILAAFFLPNEIFLISSLTLLPFSRTCKG